MDRRYAKRMAPYWEKMERQNLDTLSRIDPHSWFDYWHMHPDRASKGNKCPENRVSAVRLGYTLLVAAEGVLAARSAPVQCFATFNKDTRDNAVFIHSDNPNGTPFPQDFDGVQWGAGECAILNSIVDLKKHRIGKMVYKSDSYFIVSSLTG